MSAPIFKRYIVTVALLIAPRFCCAQETVNSVDENLPPNSANYRMLAQQVESALRHDVLGVWFPRCVDPHGGFHADFSPQWKIRKSEGKFSVFQGRMTWIAAQVALRRPDLRDEFLPIAKHGFSFLHDVMWDEEKGGFFWGLDDDGKISPNFTDGKELYGIGFCIYGAAAAFDATGDQKALDLASRAFRWTDQHAHDATNGGYFEWLTRNGSVVEAKSSADKVPVAAFPIGQKSMNTHIHLLESFTALYEVWQDPPVKSRVKELLELIRDKICIEQGAMNLYFTNDWKPTADRDSYGHDVETAYLLLEAAHAIGEADNSKTQAMAKRLVDHALSVGWDKTHGGFFNEGKMLGDPDDLRKDWWVQFEGANSLLLMHELYGANDDRYFKAFARQWRFIREHQADHEFGGFYERVEADGAIASNTKAQMWKAAYHDGRALLNVSDRLNRLANQ